MINVHLIRNLESEKFLSPTQCGLRNMSSTTNALIRMESSIYEAFSSKQHHLTVFFFFYIWKRHMTLPGDMECLKLMYYEFYLREELPLFIKTFLKTRLFQVPVGSATSSTLNQEEAVPQRNTLSVMLYA